MLHHYSDIRSKLGEPRWWDEHGVPRYCDFSPNTIADIYARTCALILIACQNCGHTFKVAMSWGAYDVPQLRLHRGPQTLADVATVHYGDPPNIGCCPSGPTMNCDDLKVIEWWQVGRGHEWARISAFEVLLPDHPEYEAAQ